MTGIGTLDTHRPRPATSRQVVCALSIALLSAGALLLALAVTAPEADAAFFPDAIHIVGDANFTKANGVVSGDGSAGDPYVIERWEMTCSTVDPFKIDDTRAHVVVKDLLFTGTLASADVVFLHNATNVTVSNITIRSGFTPLEIRNCHDIVVRNLTTTAHGWVHVFYSSRIDLLDVDISTDEGRFYLVTSNDTRFVRCHAGNSYQPGFRMQSGRRVSIIDCTANGTSIGLELQGDMYDCVVTGSRFLNSESVNARIHGRNNTLAGNDFGDTGIYADLSGWHSIARNNTVGGRPLESYRNETGRTLSGSISQVLLLGCRGFVVENARSSGACYPILCHDIEDCTFRGIVSDGATRAIEASQASRCTFSDITGDPVVTGLILRGSDNCTLEHLEFNAQPPETTHGLYTVVVQISDSDNVTMRDSLVTGIYWEGVTVAGGRHRATWASIDRVTVIGTNCTGSYTNGIRVEESANVTIANCTLWDTGVSVSEGGSVIVVDSAFSGDMEVYGVSTYYCRYAESRRNTFDRMGFGISLEQTDMYTIVGNEFRECGGAIAGSGAKARSVVRDNSISGCGSGIGVGGEVEVVNNTLTDVSTGINLYESRCSVHGNTIVNSTYDGICVEGEWHRIFNNVVRAGSIGIHLVGCRNCTIEFNEVTDQTQWAFRCLGGFDNVVHHNIIDRNNFDVLSGTYKGPQATSEEGTDFEAGYGGNWWGDYQARYPLARAARGVWDTPYALAGGKEWDDLPLANDGDAVPPTAGFAGGAEVTIDQNTTYEFDGSPSSDDVGVTGYYWTFVYGGAGQNLSGPVAKFTFDWPGLYDVTFKVFDAWGNSDELVVRLSVVDTWPPSAVAGDDIMVDAGVPFLLDASGSWDNSGTIIAEWTIDPGGLEIHGHGILFLAAVDVTGRFLAVLNVSDPAGHLATDSLWIDVVDRVPPVFLGDATPPLGTTGDPLTFEVRVVDNLGLGAVWLVYRYGGGEASNASMLRSVGDSWNLTIIVADTVDDIEYRAGAVDMSGHANWSSWRTVDVVDDDPPEVLEDLSDPTATTGEEFHARIRVADNIGVRSVGSDTANWTGQGADAAGNGVYEAIVPLDDDTVGPWTLEVRVVDLAGNVRAYLVATPPIIDNDPPEFWEVYAPDGAVRGTDILLRLVVFDHVTPDVAPVDVEYTAGQCPTRDAYPMVGRRMEGSMAYLWNATIHVPREAEGILVIRCSVVDAAGNWAHLADLTLALVNLPPVLGQLPDWEVKTSEDAEYDLAPFLSDRNDEVTSLTVRCSDARVRVDGLVLRVHQDRAIANWTVRITVSDGDDEGEGNLTIHVVGGGPLPATGLRPAHVAAIAAIAVTVIAVLILFRRRGGRRASDLAPDAQGTAGRPV